VEIVSLHIDNVFGLLAHQRDSLSHPIATREMLGLGADHLASVMTDHLSDLRVPGRDQDTSNLCSELDLPKHMNHKGQSIDLSQHLSREPCAAHPRGNDCDAHRHLIASPHERQTKEEGRL
jgi:hypothetical protein